jgi:hypothetical protein
MKFKKALSAVLAGTMAFALMVAPAFADTTVTGTNINGSDGAAASFSVDYTASATVKSVSVESYGKWQRCL